MLRVSLIGAGDTEFHYEELLGLSREDYEGHVKGIAESLGRSGVELVILPDRGVSYEVAKRFRQVSENKIHGTVPNSDKDFGIKHLEEYIKGEVDGKKIVSDIVDTGTWYKQDLTHCLYGDVILMMGRSTGSLGELSYAYYLYKLFGGKKPEVQARKKQIHPDIIAGDNMPLSVIIYMPFHTSRLSKEEEAYIRKFEGEVYYVDDPERLEQALKEMQGAQP